MTEYQEITRNYTLEDFQRELKFQLDLGYIMGDSFPSYLQHHIDLINRTNNEQHSKNHS